MKKTITCCDICECVGATTYEVPYIKLPEKEILTGEVDLCGICREAVTVLIKDEDGEFYIRRD